MKLSLATALENQALQVRYELTNELDVDVLVPQFRLSRERPPIRGGYVHTHRSGELLVYFGTAPNPPLVCSVQPERLGAELLRPAERLRASIALDVPILEHGTLRPARADAPHEKYIVSTLRLVVCYLPCGQPGLKTQPVAGTSLQIAWGVAERKVEANASLQEPIAAQRRTDDLYRAFE